MNIEHRILNEKLGYQLKAGHFPLFAGFASLNPPYKVQLVADAGWF